MLFVLKRVTPPQFEQLQNDESLISDDDFITGSNNETELWLDKYWDLLQAIFTEDKYDFSSTQGKIISGGIPVNEEFDTGYCPPLYINPTDIASINQFIRQLPDSFAPSRINELKSNSSDIYSFEDLEDYSDEQIANLSAICNELIEKLKRFYHEAEENYFVIKIIS